MSLDSNDRAWLKKLLQYAVMAIVYALKDAETAAESGRYFVEIYKGER